MKTKTYDDEYISVNLTEDEFEIINNAIELLENTHYDFGFELIIKTLKDKFEDIKAVLNHG